MTKGTDIIPVISRIISNWVLAASDGAVKIHGNGSVITNQMIESKAIISTFFFVRGFIIPQMLKFYSKCPTSIYYKINSSRNAY